jgi:two-component system phosphate regulon sensor histidine kinase PhoR
MPTVLIQSFLDAVNVPLILVGGDQRVIAANPAARSMFGAVAPGRHFLTVLRQPDVLGLLEHVLASGPDAAGGKATYRIPGQSREEIYLVRCAPVGDGATGRMALLSFEDRSDLEQVGEIRRDFVANVSHELRTPLTALLGFIETLRGAARQDSVARERFLSVMQREAERMNRLVSDLMSLSRVEAEERVRPRGPVDVAAIVRSCIAALRPVTEEAGVRVIYSGPQTPVMVQADADQLTQVFNNLIENAMKYGASNAAGAGRGDEVRVELSEIGRDAVLRGPAVRIDVIDQGDGIDPIHIPRLTERFYRVDTHRSREKGGTGLGLAIVKHIVIRHRGRLLIDSEKGKGSQFSVILPMG